MRYWIFFILSLILAVVFNIFGSWWMIVFGPFLASFFIKLRPSVSFTLGFIAIMLLWGVLQANFIFRGAGEITGKVASILPFLGSKVLLVLFTLFLGGLLGGLSAICAAYWRRAFFPSTSGRPNPVSS
ncbi:MAG TPA: hypothetical protein PK076_04940 [Saprospiraceae bacterium]|nr:hypothetical protein [Saprospiraceae bacterium]HQW55446.1 hypothetical protein [Saprospiraceae bacterium]